ncbi:hypothetical protein Cgig2_019815 [Carnegiea gigantea]|uniref:Uncharacterized protein n=1 Tax=Carnegiea gigantea TaxID=171969 RepID=A0A9Q1JYD6_9CARY|nr:hypothetical protein Cgig2_019815 [Carnegiea gigantea]
MLEIAHSTVSKKVSSTNPSNRTRALIDLLLARFNERLYNHYDHHGHDAMLHETNDDRNYKGNVTELWWRSSRRSGELRRIIGGKEIVDMAPKLRKCNIVYIYVVDKPLEGLTLPWVTYNFVNENEVIDQNNNLLEPSLTTNVERVGKTDVTYASQTPIELPSIRKQLIRRSLFTSRQNGDVSTATNGRDGSTTPTGKNSAKARFVAPGFLCHGRLSGLKKPSCPKSSVRQNPSEQHLINALKGASQDEAKANAAKKNVNDGVAPQEDNDTRNSQKDYETTNAQKENHDILQAHSDKDKGCENSVSNDALISGGKLTVTRKAINPSKNDSPDNEARISAERRKRKRGIVSRPRRRNKGGKDGKVPNIAEIFKATRKRKDDTLNEEDATLYDQIVDESGKNSSTSQFELADLKAELQPKKKKKKQLLSELTNRVVNIEQLEASHQKKISDVEASHQRDIGEFLKEIKLLKNVVLPLQHSTATPSLAP